MADTIKLPGMGPTNKKTVYAGLGVLAVAVGIYYYRKRNAAATASTTTTDGSNIDPATGYETGSPQDLAALAAQGQVPPDYSPGTVVNGMGGPTPTYTYPAASFATNDQWGQAAESYLVAQVGLDAPTVSAALGAYIAGKALTASQQSVIEQAIAQVGQPPIPGTNGYPPSIRTQAVTPPVQLKNVVDEAKLSAPTNARQLVQQHSDPSASANNVEANLRLTYNDPRNAPYRGYYQSHGGWWPAKAAIWVHASRKA